MITKISEFSKAKLEKLGDPFVHPVYGIDSGIGGGYKQVTDVTTYSALESDGFDLPDRDAYDDGISDEWVGFEGENGQKMGVHVSEVAPYHGGDADYNGKLLALVNDIVDDIRQLEEYDVKMREIGGDDVMSNIRGTKNRLEKIAKYLKKGSD